MIKIKIVMKFKKLNLFSSHTDKVRVAKWDQFAKNRLKYYIKENQSKDDFNDNKNKVFRDVADKYTKHYLLAKHKSELSNIPGNKITPEIEKQILKSNEPIFHENTARTGFYYNDPSTHAMNINPDTSDDSTLSHEYQHMKNYINGEHPSDKYTESNNKFNNSSNLPDSLSNSNDVNNYIHDVLEEENSANRGRLMNSYVHAGDKLSNDELEKIYNKSISDQETYASLVGNPYLQNLRYNMDKDTYNKFKNRESL